MTPKELKNSILQLAIEGKLVEQRKEEGSAETLYAEIQKEKQKLIKQGKIKKEKELSEITSDEVPFEIPKSWKWVRLGEIGQTNIGLTYSPKDISDKGTIVLRSSNIKNGKLDFNDNVFVNINVPENKICKKSDILICARNGSKSLVGKSAIITKGNMSFGAFMAIYRSKCNDYVLYIINSSYFRNGLLNETGTTTINQITQDMLKNFIIPLPPLDEQKRIVEKIEELMPLVDRYEVLYNKLNELNKEFPKKLKNAVLQKAIEGKLVLQVKSEGNADDLYKEIQKEKQKLIKQGKIKKEKEIPKITDVEIPFKILKSWKLIKLNELCDIINGFTPLRTNEKFWKNGDIPWFTIDDIHNQGRIINYTNQKITKDALSKDSNRLLPKDTVLLCCTASVGEYAITKIPLTTNQQFNGLVIKKYWRKYFSSDFLLLLVQTFKDRLINVAGKTTFNFISVKKLGDFVIPFPPLAEQKRIVEKIEEILPNIEKLENILYK